jgi:hypothetical protein
MVELICDSSRAWKAQDFQKEWILQTSRAVTENAVVLASNDQVYIRVSCCCTMVDRDMHVCPIHISRFLVPGNRMGAMERRSGWNHVGHAAVRAARWRI